jgi:hypothetical protein
MGVGWGYMLQLRQELDEDRPEVRGDPPALPI